MKLFKRFVVGHQVSVGEDVRDGQGDVRRQRGEEERGPDDEDLAPRFRLQLKECERNKISFCYKC
jgi:hypothetical protein